MKHLFFAILLLITTSCSHSKKIDRIVASQPETKLHCSQETLSLDDGSKKFIDLYRLNFFCNNNADNQLKIEQATRKIDDLTKEKVSLQLQFINGEIGAAKNLIQQYTRLHTNKKKIDQVKIIIKSLLENIPKSFAILESPTLGNLCSKKGFPSTLNNLRNLFSEAFKANASHDKFFPKKNVLIKLLDENVYLKDFHKHIRDLNEKCINSK